MITGTLKSNLSAESACHHLQTNGGNVCNKTFSKTLHQIFIKFFNASKKSTGPSLWAVYHINSTC